MINWQDIITRHEELNNQLISGNLDNNKRHPIQKEFSFLSNLLNKYKDITNFESEYNKLVLQLNNLDNDTDIGLRELYNEELDIIQKKINLEYQALENLLFPADEKDNSSVFLEIRAGAGGQEASLFAANLLEMYTAYAIRKGWHVSVTSSSETDLGGYREIVLHIDGKNVYGHLKWESGVHRVQRVPATETQGRVHTSTATVAILPEAEETDLSINNADLRIDVYRASGAGGQHVNTTDSAVRITHIPTGVVVTCQDERSQHKNKAKAMKMLQSRLVAAQHEKQEAEMSQKRKELVGTGTRSEKVRTYNFPQNRITDHQVNLTLKKLDMVMTGQLDEIIDALILKEREERRKKPLQLLSKT